MRWTGDVASREQHSRNNPISLKRIVVLPHTRYTLHEVPFPVSVQKSAEERRKPHWRVYIYADRFLFFSIHLKSGTLHISLATDCANSAELGGRAFRSELRVSLLRWLV